MIRKAKEQDLSKIEEIYNNIITKEEQGLIKTGCHRGIYPTHDTAKNALKREELFVYEKEENSRGFCYNKQNTSRCV